MGCGPSIPVAVGELVEEPVDVPVNVPLKSVKSVKSLEPAKPVKNPGGQLEFAPDQAKEPSIEYCNYSKKKVRALRSTLEPFHQEGIRRRNTVKLSPTRFVIPEYWYNVSVEEWPHELHYLKYSAADFYISKKESSKMISCIHEKYYLDEELLSLAAYLTHEKSQNRHEFVIRTEIELGDFV